MRQRHIETEHNVCEREWEREANDRNKKENNIVVCSENIVADLHFFAVFTPCVYRINERHSYSIQAFRVFIVVTRDCLFAFSGSSFQWICSVARSLSLSVTAAAVNCLWNYSLLYTQTHIKIFFLFWFMHFNVSHVDYSVVFFFLFCFLSVACFQSFALI